jgi:hypothetical protein
VDWVELSRLKPDDVCEWSVICGLLANVINRRDEMDLMSGSGKQQSIAAFLFNCCIGFGEFAVPMSWLNRLSPTRSYHWTASIFLALLGIPLVFLLAIWTAGRCLWTAVYYTVSLQWLRYWLGLLPGTMTEAISTQCSHSHTCDVPSIVGNEHEYVEVCLDCGFVKVRLVSFDWEPDNFIPPLLPQALEKMAKQAAAAR